MPNYKSQINFVFLALFLCHFSVQAQSQKEKYSFEFRGQELSQVLEKVADKTGLDVVYDPKIVADIHIYKRINDQSPHDLLNSILVETPLDFITLSSGTIVIIQALQSAPAYGSYYGKVVDSKTDEPLPGASVMLADASGGTSAGPSGSFAFNKLMSGSYKIIFSYVGYKPVAKTIQINRDQALHDKITLQPKSIPFSPVVITGYASQMPDETNKSVLKNPIISWKISGKMQDPIRSLSLFSGVQYGMPLTNLHVQGGQRGEHRIRLDGVPVYNPYSFGRMFSAFSPYAIGKIRLYKAGYEVPEGSEIAGLIDLSHDVEAVDKNRLIMQGDPLSVNIRGDLFFPGITGKESSLKIMAVARSNYWNIYKKPTLRQTLQKWDNLDPLITNAIVNLDSDPSLYEAIKHHSDVRFYDVHFASKYKINQYNTLDGSFYRGGNYVETDLLRQAPATENLPEYFYGRDGYKWKNLMGQLTFTSDISPRFGFSSQISFSSNRLNQQYLLGTSDNTAVPGINLNSSFAYNSFQSASAKNSIPSQNTKNRISHFRIKADGVYQLNPRFNFQAGIEIDHVHSNVDLADLFYLPTQSDQKSTLYSGYLNANWHAGSYWKFTLGDRLTYLHSSNEIYTEPRAAVQYNHPGNGLNNWNIRLAGGLYRQFINQYEITNPGPTALVPSLTIWSHAGTEQKPKSWHLSGSFHINPSRTTSLNFSSFYKWQPTTYTVSYGNLLDGVAVNRSSFNAFAETTKMKNFGAGIRINQSLAESVLQFMAGYDYSFNRIDKESQFGRSLPPPWNEPHRFQLRALWHFRPQFTVVSKWKSIWGRSWGFRQAYYNFLLYKSQDDFGEFSFDSPENDRMKPFHQLDFSFLYRPELSVMDLEIRLDLINILNRKNSIDWTLQKNDKNADKSYKKVNRTMPGFNPSLSIRIEF